MFGVGVGGARVHFAPLALQGDEGAAGGLRGPRDGGGAGRAAPQPEAEAARGAFLELALVVLVAARRQPQVPVPPEHAPKF